MAFATDLPNKLEYIQYVELSMDEKMKFIVEQHGFELLNQDYVDGLYQLIESSWYFKQLLSQMDVMDVIDEWYQFMGMWLCDRDSFVRIYDDIQLGHDEDDRLLYYLVYMDLRIDGWARMALDHMDGWLEVRQLLLDGIHQLHYENVCKDLIGKSDITDVEDMIWYENENYVKDLISNNINGNVADIGNLKKCAKSHVEDVNWNVNENNEDDEYYDDNIQNKMMRDNLIDEKKELMVNDNNMKLLNQMEIHYYGDINIGKNVNNDINRNYIMDDKNDEYDNSENNSVSNDGSDSSEDSTDEEMDSSEDSMDDISDDGESSDDEPGDYNGFEDDNNSRDSNDEDECDDDDDIYDGDGHSEGDDMDGDQSDHMNDDIMNLKIDLNWYKEGENMFKNVYLLIDWLFSKYINSCKINNKNNSFITLGFETPGVIGFELDMGACDPIVSKYYQDTTVSIFDLLLSMDIGSGCNVPDTINDGRYWNRNLFLFEICMIDKLYFVYNKNNCDEKNLLMAGCGIPDPFFDMYLDGINTSDASDPGFNYVCNNELYLNILCNNNGNDKTSLLMAGSGAPDPFYGTSVSIFDTYETEYNKIYGLKILGLETPDIDCFSLNIGATVSVFDTSDADYDKIYYVTTLVFETSGVDYFDMNMGARDPIMDSKWNKEKTVLIDNLLCGMKNGSGSNVPDTINGIQISENNLSVLGFGIHGVENNMILENNNYVSGLYVVY